MKILKTVSYEEVEKIFKTDHPVNDFPGHETNGWALRHAISGANKKCRGIWSYVELEPKEILSIFLPWHEYDCEKNNPLIPPKTKMNVGDTVIKILNDKTYSSNNPVCWRKIDYWIKREKIVPLFLSTKPVTNLPEYEAYRDIENIQGNLFHLDGFHRMISLGLKGNYTTPIYAYVAGIK